MIDDVYLEMRSGATLDVTANLNIGDQLIVKTSAALTQSSNSILTVGKDLYLAAMYSIADTARLSIGLNLFMASNARLSIVGDGTSVITSTVTPTNSEVHGLITYILGPTGAGAIDLGGGELTIGSTTARIHIDASGYAGGANLIPLIHQCSSIIGSFDPANIDITGLAGGLSGSVVSRSDGLYLELIGGGPPSPTTSTTPSPTTSNPTTANPTTANPTTASPTTASPTPNPTPSPIQSPVVTTTTEATTTTTTTTATTQTTEPETTSTSTTTTTTATTTSTTPPPASTTTIVLTETGFNAITSTGTCPPQDITSIVIDGSAYTGGPGTITLYECTAINASYDLINIRLINFPEGLWYELSYKSDSIDLVIKSLANYEEYWVHVRNTYTTEEYPEQVHTDHFPEFNWDTVPTWTRFRKNANVIPEANRQPWNYNSGPWTDNEIESIARNNFLSWYGLNTPDHVIETWERIKSKDASHKTMYYWNAESFWGTSGIGLEQSYLSVGTVGTGGRKLYDHSNPEMREWWVAHGLEMSQQASSNGVFTDNTISRECDNQACNLETTDKSIMVKSLAEAVPDDVLDIGNYLRQMIDGGNRFRMPYADGSYFENTHFSPGNQDDLEGIIVSMQLAREASWKKKVVMWTGSRRNCGCGYNNPDINFCSFVGETDCIPQYCNGFVQTNGVEPTALLENDFEIALAEFLMIVERWSYANFNISPDASCEPWRWDWSHLDLFTKPLGQPL